MGTLDDPDSYLLMEFVDGVNLTAAKRQCTPQEYDQLQLHLAELVLKMHSTRRRSITGRIGGRPDVRMLAGVSIARLRPDLAGGREAAAIAPEAAEADLAHARSAGPADRHDDRPRLVHWDIWATNILARPDEHGKWRVGALLDPNCKFAHAEAEIAYMELFHTITPAFLMAYQRKRKLSDAYRAFASRFISSIR